MIPKTTIHDIARALNTTISTVSRALSDHPGISQKTKIAVREMAEKLNYRQNKIASSLRSGKTHTIGVIIPSAELHFFGSVVHAIEQVMSTNGYSVLLYQTNESFEAEKRGIETFLQLHVEGIIASIALGSSEYQHFFELKKRRIPLVLFDRTCEELEVPSVKIDDYQGGYLATEHLIQQGYTRIAHITSHRQIRIFSDRLEGYRAALAHYGLEAHADWVAYADISIESGSACTGELLNLPLAPDAIFAAEDLTAMGALQKLKAIDVHVPGQFGVMGFANEAFSGYITPSLSTVDQQTKKMGQAACELLLQGIRFPAKPIVSEQLVLEPLLIVRESSQSKTPPNPAQ